MPCPFTAVFCDEIKVQRTVMKMQKNEKIVIAGERSRRSMIQERSPFRQGWQRSEAMIGQHGRDPHH